MKQTRESDAGWWAGFKATCPTCHAKFDLQKSDVEWGKEPAKVIHIGNCFTGSCPTCRTPIYFYRESDYPKYVPYKLPILENPKRLGGLFSILGI